MNPYRILITLGVAPLIVIAFVSFFLAMPWFFAAIGVSVEASYRWYCESQPDMKVKRIYSEGYGGNISKCVPE